MSEVRNLVKALVINEVTETSAKKTIELAVDPKLPDDERVDRLNRFISDLIDDTRRRYPDVDLREFEESSKNAYKEMRGKFVGASKPVMLFGSETDVLTYRPAYGDNAAYFMLKLEGHRFLKTDKALGISIKPTSELHKFLLQLFGIDGSGNRRFDS